MPKKDLAYLLAKKQAHEPIVMLTCYDYLTARIQDEAGIDSIFVGDSVGTNVLGYTSETEVTMDDMLHHLRAVRRGVQNAYLLVDLPAGSYETPALALKNARRFMEVGADGVKLEGGIERVEVVQTLTAAGIQVCGHIGYTPQTLGPKGRVQGRSLEQGKALLRAALALEQAGIGLLVLELVSEPISRLITRQLSIPTIGIGSGRFCDGQVLVVTDILGLAPGERKMLKRYDHLHERYMDAFTRYKDEVRQRLFPGAENAFNKIADEDLAHLEQWVEQGMPAGE